MMASAQNVEVNVQEAKNKLRGIVDTTDKKKTPSKEVKKEFVTLWIELAETTKIDNDCVDLFFDGFRIAESEPLYMLAVQTDSANAYTRLLATVRASKNLSGCTLKAMLNLFALELGSPSSGTALDFIANRIPALAKNKENKQTKNLSTMIKNQVLGPLSNHPIDARAQLRDVNARSLHNLVGHSLENFINDKNLNNARKSAAMSLLGWLREQSDQNRSTNDAMSSDGTSDEMPETVQTTAPASETPSEARVHHVLSSSEEAGQHKKQPTATDETIPTLPHKDGKYTSIDSDMSQVIAFLQHFQMEYASLKQQLEQSAKAKDEASSQANDYRSMLNQAQHELESLREQNTTLNDSDVVLQQRIDELEKENDSLRESLSSAEEMLTMIEERDAHQAEIADEKMLQELRFEYEDYTNALELNMTVDLGENMRDQLGNVFEILKSGGIDL